MAAITFNDGFSFDGGSNTAQLSEEQLIIQQVTRDFAKNEIKPGVIERDEHQKFLAEQVKKRGELGFRGMMVSEK